MQSQLFALSGPVVTVPSPLDALAEELGSESARIERELRRELAAGMAEIQRELETLRRHSAELDLRVVTAEHARDAAIRERLATLRDGADGASGTSVTLDDVRQIIAEEIARQREAAPKPPDTDELEAIAATVFERRIDYVAKCAADLVPVPEMPPPPEMPDIPALIADEIANREDGIVTQAVSRVSETVTEQIQRVFPGIAQRAAELVPPPPELPDISALIADEISSREGDIVNQAVSRVSETVTEQIQLAVPGIAQRVAELVPSPELSDIPALISNEISNREDDIINQAVVLTRETVAEQIQRVFPGIAQRAAELVPSPPELPDIPALIADEISNREDDIVNQAVSRVSETVIEQIRLAVPGIAQRAAELVPPPELPDIPALIAHEIANHEGDIVNQAVSLTRETVAEQIQRVFPGIAQRAAELVPTPELPDIPALISDEILNREDGIVNRAVSRVSEAVIEQIQLAVPGIAKRAADLVPVPEIPLPPELPDIPALIANEISNREDDLAERAAGLVKVPALPDISTMIEHHVAAAFVTVRVPQDGADADPVAMAVLAQEKVDEAVASLASAFINQVEAKEVAETAIDRALGALPAQITVDDLRPAIEAEFARQFEAVPKVLSAAEIGELAESAAVFVVNQRTLDIAKRAAELVPPVELPALPDVVALVADELTRREGDIAERAAKLVPTPDAPVLPDIGDMMAEEVQRAIKDALESQDGHTLKENEIESIVEMVAQRVAAALPASVTVDDVRILIDAVPKPLNGDPGPPGEPGRNADPVTQDQIIEAVAAAPEAIHAAMQRYLADNPLPKGDPGPPGESGRNADPVTQDQILAVIRSMPEMPEMEVSNDVGEHVSRAAKMLAESPDITPRDQSIVLNINAAPSERTHTISKKITTTRDKDGNLAANVVETVQG